MTKEKSFECGPNVSRSTLISSVPKEQCEGFFPDSGRYNGLHTRGFIDRLLFWKKDKTGGVLTQEDLQENGERTADDEDVESVGVVVAEVLNLVFTAPLRVVSPITKVFQPPRAKEKPVDVAPPGGMVRLASARFEELMAPSPPHQGFWPKLYHHFVAEFGSMFLTESLHWIGQAGALLWMLLPTSWVIMAWEKLSRYWRRLWRAFSNQFRLPPRYRDPFKGLREYLLADISKQDGTGTGHYKYAVGATLAGFAYHNQQLYERRDRKSVV